MGSVGVAAACRGRVLDIAAPLLEGSSLRPTSRNHAAESRALKMCLEEGPFGLVIGMGV